MGSPLPLSVRRQQPQQPVPVDWSNPLTQGLLQAWHPYADTFTKNGSIGRAVNSAGAGVVTNGSSSYLLNTSVFRTATLLLTDCTISVLVTPSNINAISAYAAGCGHSSNNNQILAIGQGATAGNLIFRTRDASGADITTDVTPPAGTWANGIPVILTGTRSRNNSVQKLYLNGVLIGQTSVGNSNDSGFNEMSIGGLYRLAFGNAFAGSVHGLYLHSRALTDSEVSRIGSQIQNFWQLYKDPSPLPMLAGLAAAAVIPPSPTGTVSWTESDGISSISALVKNTASASWSEASDTATIATLANTNASLIWSGTNDLFDSLSNVSENAACLWEETSDTCSLSCSAGSFATSVWNESEDSYLILSSSIISNGVFWTESQDVYLTEASASATCTSQWTEDSDLTSMSTLIGQEVDVMMSWEDANDTFDLSLVASVMVNAVLLDTTDTMNMSAFSYELRHYTDITDKFDIILSPPLYHIYLNKS
jgi:hypothetical protein